MAMIPNLKDIPEKAPVEAGEYDLRITKVKETKSKKTGRYGCMMVIQIEGEDNANNIFHTMWYGNYKDYQGDDEEKSNMMWRMVKDFIRALGLDPDEETDESDLVGLEFSADVSFNDGMSTDDEGNPVRVGQPRNEILRITS